MAEIIRDRTSCYLRDDAGVEWDVVDVWERRHGGGILERYPGNERAIARLFRRTERIAGGDNRRLLEERRYDFSAGESRWFLPVEWERQLRQSCPIGQAGGELSPASALAAPVADRQADAPR